jgi:tryptophan 2,3-dioxygenase
MRGSRPVLARSREEKNHPRARADPTRENDVTQTPVVSYPTYLQLDKILNAQLPLGPVTLGPSVQAAEQFFIVVHQAFELWFKQVLTDLECAREALAAQPRDLERALDHLQRVASIHRLLYQQMVLFDHLSPHSFLAFRPYLGAASGSESEQWREVQKALGLRGQARSPLFDLLEAAAKEQRLTLLEVYREPFRAGVLYRLAEALVDISDLFWQLSAAHVEIAERTIGQREGTGGTSGVPYLREALKVKAFPELWDIRTQL